MRKIFCDWCESETPVVLSRDHSRRIPLISDLDEHKLNVVIKLEFVTENVPEDLCRTCVRQLLQRAVELLSVPASF